MKTTKNKAKNKRFARKRALKTPIDENSTKSDTLRACRREWGRGLSK